MKLGNAAASVEHLDELARRDTFLNGIHPCAKLLVTIVYLVLTASFGGGQLSGLMGMALYPFLLFTISGLSFTEALYRLRIVLPLVCVVGVFNPFFDREPVLMLFGFTMTGGMLSMVSLMVKGVLTVLASYLLIATTTIERLCYAMRMLHVPRMIVTVFLLICRYISLLIREADRIMQSYSLRAPGQKGVNFRAWGPLAGQLLLRSMDRAEVVYQSMCMRGYNEDFRFAVTRRMTAGDVLYLVIWVVVLAALRVVPILELIGGLFV